MERRYTAWGMMRLLLIAQFMLILFGVVAALAEMPPPRYDYVPTVHVVKHKVAFGQADALCKKLYFQRFRSRNFGYSKYGCAIMSVGGARPEIVYSYDPTGRDKLMSSNVLRHEYAHINGWNSSHSN